MGGGLPYHRRLYLMIGFCIFLINLLWLSFEVRSQSYNFTISAQVPSSVLIWRAVVICGSLFNNSVFTTHINTLIHIFSGTLTFPFALIFSQEWLQNDKKLHVGYANPKLHDFYHTLYSHVCMSIEYHKSTQENNTQKVSWLCHWGKQNMKDRQTNNQTTPKFICGYSIMISVKI